MNSFKKIGALLTALAVFGTLSSMPANADVAPTPFSVEVNSSINTTTSAAPLSVAVPSSNVIDAGHSVSISALADTNTAVSFTASSTVKLVAALSTELAPKNVFSGVSSASAISAGSRLTVYAYTTSTSTGYVTVVNGGYSTVVFIKGIAGPAYNVGLSVPSAVAVGTIPSVTVSSTDAFGNPVANQPVTINLVGTTFADSTISKIVFTAAVTSVADGTVLGSKSTALAVATVGTVTVFAADSTIGLPVVGLPAPVRTMLASFNVSDLNAQILALKAELAAVKAELAVEKAAHEATKKSALDAAAKAVAEATVAKSLADKALADVVAKSVADLTAVNTASAASIKDYKLKYNALAKKWNKYHSVKVALLK